MTTSAPAPISVKLYSPEFRALFLQHLPAAIRREVSNNRVGVANFGRIPYIIQDKDFRP